MVVTLQYIQPHIFSDLSKEKPDIIHVYTFRFFPVYGGIIFTYFSRIPVVATLHHDPKLNATILQRLHDQIFLGRLGRFAKIIALTEFEKGFLTNTVSEEKIAVIPNGVSDMDNLPRTSCGIIDSGDAMSST